MRSAAARVQQSQHPTPHPPDYSPINNNQFFFSRRTTAASLLPGRLVLCRGLFQDGIGLYIRCVPQALTYPLDMEQSSDTAQNVEIFKIKKLIKGLEAARG